MNVTQFAAYARGQIRATDAILATHDEHVGICSCGRPLPCSAAVSLVRRRRHFVDRLGEIDAPSVAGKAFLVCHRHVTGPGS